MKIWSANYRRVGCLRHAVEDELKKIPASELAKTFEKWSKCVQTCIDVNGRYFEKESLKNQLLAYFCNKLSLEVHFYRGFSKEVYAFGFPVNTNRSTNLKFCGHLNKAKVYRKTGGLDSQGANYNDVTAVKIACVMYVPIPT